MDRPAARACRQALRARPRRTTKPAARLASKATPMLAVKVISSPCRANWLLQPLKDALNCRQSLPDSPNVREHDGELVAAHAGQRVRRSPATLKPFCRLEEQPAPHPAAQRVVDHLEVV